MSQRRPPGAATFPKRAPQTPTPVDEAQLLQAPPAGLLHEAGAPRLASFVVRVWAVVPAGAPACRGQIVHVQSGLRGNFSDPATMLAFMAEHGAWTSVGEQKES